MKQYILSIFTLSVISCAAKAITPEKWQKYIRTVFGFMIISVILSPVLKLKKIELPSFDPENAAQNELLFDSVSEKLKKNVESDIQARLSSEFGLDVSADVLLDIDEDHKIRGVQRIVLSENITENAVKRLKEVYGCDIIEYKN